MIFAAASFSTNILSTGFWNQPVDLILYNFLVWFGWVPIVVIMVWGFTQVWLVTRQEKWVKSLKWVLLAVDVPAVTEQTPKALENMFSSLWGAYSNLTWKEKWIIGKTQALFSFEIASTEGYVQFYVRVLTRYRDVAEAGIYAAYPEAEVSEVEDYTAWAPTEYPHEVWDTWGSEIKLKESDIFPLRTYVEFEDKISGELKDPLGGILEQLAKMRPGEHFWIQMIIQPDGIASKAWRKAGEDFVNKTFGVEKKHKPGMIASAMDSVLTIPSAITTEALGIALKEDGHGEMKQEDMWKAFKITMAEKEKVEGVVKKIGKPGYKTKMRLVYIGRKGVYDKQARTAFVKGMYHQFTHLNMNGFGLHGDATPKDDYFWQAWTYNTRQGRLVRAFKNRSWGTGADPWILNTEELTSLWHFPAITVKAPLVKKAEAKRAEPPVGLPIGGEDEDEMFRPPAQRTQALEFVAHRDAAEAAHAAEGHGDTHGSNDHGSGHDDVEEPEIHVPGVSADMYQEPLEDVHEPAHAAPAQHAPKNAPKISMPHHDGEERELGLDATDMGPPADVVLPGPPLGWKEEDEKDVPPNLPV